MAKATAAGWGWGLLSGPEGEGHDPSVDLRGLQRWGVRLSQ